LDRYLHLSHGSGRRYFAVAAFLMIVVLAITIGFEVPINKQVHSWTAGAAPANWDALRDRWLWNHLYRTITAVLALVSATIGLACP
jgi:uncharacterized membrane protein